MAKTEFIRARVDEDLKINTEELFKKLGITMTEAITIFLKQCELNNGLPFEIKIPNEVTKKSFDNTEAGIELHEFDSLQDMFEELDKD